MKKKLLVTVGNPMMGDDAAGSLLAQKIRRAPLERWEALEGGSAPENTLYLIREIAPEQVLVIDAADMDLSPGEIRLIGMDEIEDPFLISTHTLPLSYLMQALREFVPEVDMVGIQPRVVAFGYPISIEVRQAVEHVYDGLQRDEIAWERLLAAPCSPELEECP
jgi:hydrogenase 3 maturation protease